MSNLVFTNIVGAITCTVGVLGLWLAGNKKRVGWLVNFIAEGLWIYYAVVLQQWALIPACIAWAAVYIRNWIKWHE